MSFKKMTLAAAITIGMVAVGGAARAADLNGATIPTSSDACTPSNIISSQQVNCPVSGTCPAMSTDGKLDYSERQVYAFPNLSGQNLVIPNENTMVQLGQSSDVSVPTKNNITGAAAPIGQNGVILNNRAGVGIAGQTVNLSEENTGCCPDSKKAEAEQPKRTGAAAAVDESCAPVNPCTGGAAPANNTFQSSSGLQIEKKIPECELEQMRKTGAAAAIIPNQFTDVSSDFWASNQINLLGSKGILAGYPDRTYRPTLPTLRSEFASMVVAGLNLEGTQAYSEKKFKDVPENHWARNDIYKAYNQGYMNGYSDNTFRPSETISRAQAFNSFAKALPGKMTAQEAQGVLASYADNNTVPDWAKIGMAESISAGLTKDSPDPTRLNPNKDASRAEMAAVIAQLRQTLALDPSNIPTGAASEIQTFPTLSLKFNDMLHARGSHIGDTFVAETQDQVTINGQVYPTGSKVHGKIVEVVMPNLDNKGSVKLAFDTIEDNGHKADLPKQILSAGITRSDNVNIIARAVQFPFVWPGKLVGTAGRSVSNIGIIASNTVQEMMGATGFAAGHVFSGEFGAAGRNTYEVGKSLAMGVVDTGKTVISGTVGLFKESGDELTYIVSPDTLQVSSINPDEVVQVAFGCPQ
ncbi:MAG: S-layer homology domain-containing protein [bacterium]